MRWRICARKAYWAALLERDRMWPGKRMARECENKGDGNDWRGMNKYSGGDGEEKTK